MVNTGIHAILTEQAVSDSFRLQHLSLRIREAGLTGGA
jgi:hypothetical protein